MATKKEQNAPKGSKDDWLSGTWVHARNVNNAIMGDRLGGHIPTGFTVAYRGKGDVLLVFRRRNGKSGLDEVHFESVFNPEGFWAAINSAWDKTNWKPDQFSKHNKGED